MTEQNEAVLRRTLNEVDRMERRSVVTFWVTALLSQGAWVWLAIGARNAEVKQTVILATIALAMTIFGGVFMLALHILRMTQKVLQAIDLNATK